MDSSSKSPAKLVKPENTLKKKVGSGGFDQKVLEKAQHSLENNTVDFRPIALELSAAIQQVLVKVKSGGIGNQEALNAVMDSVMQLNAQGSLFHYPMITQISRILVDFLEDKAVTDKNVIDIIDGYRNAINVIASMQIKDLKNPAGKELCKALSEACQRYDNLKNQPTRTNI